MDAWLFGLLWTFCCICLAISLYALITVIDLEKEFFSKKDKNSLQKNHNEWKNKPPITVARPKGHWD